MHTSMQFLADNPYILLFLVVGLSVVVGKLNIKGYGLGMVAAAIILGCAVSLLASSVGVKLQLDEFTKSLFYYLFMYGVGLRVGPSFINSLRGDGLKFVLLAVISSCAGLSLVVLGDRLLSLPIGAAGGMLAGSQTMSAAIGSAEQAVSQGAVVLPPGVTPEGVSAMIALSYGITYIWGTVGIVLICKYLPRWWGIDAKAAAREYEKDHGVLNVDDSGLTGYSPFDMRAYRLDNSDMAGKTIGQFRESYPMYRVFDVQRGQELLPPQASLVLQQGDIIALGGKMEDMLANMGVLGPEVHDAKVLSIPLDQGEILVANSDFIGKPLKDFKNSEIAGQLQVTRMERAGMPFPVSLETKLQRLDVLYVAGLKNAVARAGALLGVIARHNTSTDLFTLSLGMILGFCIGLIEVPLAGAKVGLGNAGGLLLSGIIVSSLYSRLRFFGNTPNAARNILEDMGLVVFVAIVGVNAGASLLEQLTGVIALKIFLVGFVACTVPPFIVWTIGLHIMHINPAVLMGAVAGSRSHSGPAREAAKEIDSSVPWLGFPVGYAVSGILLTIFGYVAMVLAQ